MSIFLGALLSFHALAAPPIPSALQNQHLTAVDYSGEGKQTGCGLRATAESGGNLWLNVLLSVFIQDSGATFGMFKVSIKSVNLADGASLLQDGKLTYSNIGKIRKAWVKTDSGAKIAPNEEGRLPHDDAYMTSLEFNNAMGLLAAMSRENFRVGYSVGESGPGEVFEFDQRITKDEARKLIVCMKSLMGAVEESRNGRSF